LGLSALSEEDLIVDYSPHRRLGRIHGPVCQYQRRESTFKVNIAAASGPVIIGAVFERTGSYQIVLFVSLAMVLVASAVFASLPGYPQPRTASM
jgi:hypothetical protein